VHKYLLDLLSDAIYINEVEWIPQKTWKSSGDGWMRLIGQPWTANEFWDIWVSFDVKINPYLILQ
jgi:hypothetical protein